MRPMPPVGSALAQPLPLGAVLSASRDEPTRAPAEARSQRLLAMTREHFELVWRLMRRLGVPHPAVEDATQEVFLVAARRIELIAPGSEKSYLFGTALRVAQGFRRRLSREQARTVPFEDREDESQASPEALVAQKQRVAELDAILDELSAEEREVFVLFELEGLSLSEIAEVTKVPRGTVASRLRRARTRFVFILRRSRGHHG